MNIFNNRLVNAHLRCWLALQNTVETLPLTQGNELSFYLD